MHDIVFHNAYLMDPLDPAVADRISPIPITDIYSSVTAVGSGRRVDSQHLIPKKQQPAYVEHMYFY
jgi:hypothetical protein